MAVDDRKELAEAATELDATATAARGRRRAAQETPAAVGRYRILRRLGEGGMGAVYEAHDGELDRRVALKVLHPSRETSDASSSEGNARLLREAQAMARLSHPNTIHVYDVGIAGDRVFIAMELVSGPTLADWMRAARPLRDVLDVFLQAGDGLRAAHAAGLVHRDFKPANVLVGDDGRVRVLDFGLARAPTRRASGAIEVPGDVPAPTSVELTEIGAVIGTPAYMSPEQHVGAGLDARSDQFSFCVSLWEAAYGARPFSGATTADLATATSAGRVAEPPDGMRGPPRLERALRRGLSPAARDRWPSMDAVLAELRAIRHPRRRWMLPAAAVALLATGAIGYAQLAGAPPPLCERARDHLAGVWDADVRARVDAALAASDRPTAAFARTAVVDRVDDYADAWVTMRTDACEATRVRGEQSDALLDLRMACLDRRLADVRAITELLATAGDPRVVDNAVEAVMKLPPLAACADAAALSAAHPPPDDPAVRARVDALRAQLAEAAARKAAGLYGDGVELAARVAAEARGLPYAPIRAEALYAYGDLLDWSGDAAAAERELRAAAHAAAEARDDRTLAASWIALVYVVGPAQGRYDEALEIASFAGAAATRAGDDELRGRLANNVGAVHHRRGDHREALAHFERAVELRTAALGADHPDVASSLSNAGAALASLGELDRAQTAHERALAIVERSLGPDHPRAAAALVNLGAVASQRRDHDAAEAFETRALAIKRRAYGDAHYEVGASLSNLGQYALARDACADAVPRFEQALAVFAEALPADHPVLSHTLSGLGECLVRLGRPADAVAPLSRAVALAEAGGDPMAIAHARFALGMALWDARADRGRAVALVRQARDAYAGLGGPGQEWRAQAEAWLDER